METHSSPQEVERNAPYPVCAFKQNYPILSVCIPQITLMKMMRRRLYLLHALYIIKYI